MVLKKIHLIEIYLFFFCVLLEAVVGKILADYNLPIFFQPMHLILAMICFGCLAGVLVNYKTESN